ncbi:MAG: restriction endonuclease subunit S [Actinobacteria bacterium]|nr:restriction endonuclease subunit S [Actinomycetota bacterium]
MSRIDELIAEHCPDGVRYVEAAQLFHLRNGYTPSKSNASFWSEGTIPWFRMEDIRANGGVLDRALQQIPEAAVKGGKLFPANSLLVATSATIGEHALVTVPHLSNQRFTSLSIKSEYADQVDMKFMYYYGFVLDEWCRNNTTTSSFASVDMTGFKKFRFPVPPLEVQREIVRVLDQFTQLEAELEAELEARRRQYEHYRSVITRGDGSARLSALGDHIDFGGRNVAPDRMPETTVSIYSLPAFDRGIGPELTTPADVGSAKSRVAEPSLLVAKLNPHIPRVWRVDAPDEGAYASPEFYQLIPKDNLSLEYLEHLVGASMSKLAGMVTGSTNSHKRLQREHIASLMVRIPSLREQAEASALLTRMHNLVNDLSVGLPAELAARRKQYEYYRDKLLTFEEAAA